MNKYMPFLSIFSFLSLFSYVIAAFYKPTLVLESFEGWPLSVGWRSTKVRWPQRIWGICAFIGLVVMVVFVVHGMLHWIPDSNDTTDEDGDPSDNRDFLIFLLSLVGSFVGMWMLVGFARLQFENESLKYMVFHMREVLLGTAWKRQSIAQDVKKSFTEKPRNFSHIFRIYDLHEAKQEVLWAVAELTENIKKESDQNAERKIRENCEKEKCTLWVKQKEKARIDNIDTQRFLEKMEIEIESGGLETGHEYLTEQIVKEIIFEKLGVKANQIKNKASLYEDLGADDEEVEDLITAIEDQFVLKIPPQEAVKFRTVGDIVKYLQVNGEKIDLSEERSIEIAMELGLINEKIEEERRKSDKNNPPETSE